MKVIDLLNKIANDEIDEETRYKFSAFDYCTIKEFFDRYIVDKENLNLEIIEEDNKIEKIKKVVCDSDLIDRNHFVIEYLAEVKNKINEIIEVINNEYNK